MSRLDRRAFLSAAGLSALAVAGSRAAQAAPPEADAGARARWAMVVDLRACRGEQGCTDCLVACAEAHNVPAIAEPAHEVKWIWKEPFGKVFADESPYAPDELRGTRVPVLCSHCDRPPCVRVCPVQATWKRADGIVMMDWHRCIGCRYCMAACPYGARSFNWVDPRPRLARVNRAFPTRTRGVVEACNFCEERLAAGRRPACVEACPAKALVFGNLADRASEVRQMLRARHAIRRRPHLGTGPNVHYVV